MYWTKRVAIISMIFFTVQGVTNSDLSAISQDAKSRHEAVVQQKREKEQQFSHAIHPKRKAKRKVLRHKQKTREALRQEREERQKKYLEEREAKRQASLHEDFNLTPSQRRKLSSAAVEEKKLDYQERIARLREMASREERRIKASKERSELLERIKVEQLEARAQSALRAKEKRAAVLAKNEQLKSERKASNSLKKKAITKIPEKKQKSSDEKCGWFWWNNKPSQEKQKEKAERDAQKELSRVSRALHKERLRSERANKLKAIALEKRALKDQKRSLKKK